MALDSKHETAMKTFRAQVVGGTLQTDRLVALARQFSAVEPVVRNGIFEAQIETAFTADFCIEAESIGVEF